MLRIILVCAAFLIPQIAQADEPYSFKWLKLGESKSTIGTDGFTCKDGNGIISDTTCYMFHGTTIADTEAEIVALYFYNDILQRVTVTFKESEFEKVRISIQNKYGVPSNSKKTTVQNKMGASFENTTVTWNNGVSMLELEQRSGRVDDSQASYSLKSYETEFNKRFKQSTNKSANDL